MATLSNAPARMPGQQVEQAETALLENIVRNAKRIDELRGEANPKWFSVEEYERWPFFQGKIGTILSKIDRDDISFSSGIIPEEIRALSFDEKVALEGKLSKLVQFSQWVKVFWREYESEIKNNRPLALLFADIGDDFAEGFRFQTDSVSSIADAEKLFPLIRKELRRIDTLNLEEFVVQEVETGKIPQGFVWEVLKLEGVDRFRAYLSIRKVVRGLNAVEEALHSTVNVEVSHAQIDAFMSTKNGILNWDKPFGFSNPSVWSTFREALSVLELAPNNRNNPTYARLEQILLRSVGYPEVLE